VGGAGRWGGGDGMSEFVGRKKTNPQKQKKKKRKQKKPKKKPKPKKKQNQKRRVPEKGTPSMLGEKSP